MRTTILFAIAASLLQPAFAQVQAVAPRKVTGQKLSAQEALALGVVNEVMPAADLLPRAYELARMILKRPPLVVRYARTCMVAELKRQVQSHLEYAAALEGLAGVDLWPAEFE